MVKDRPCILKILESKFHRTMFLEHVRESVRALKKI